MPRGGGSCLVAVLALRAAARVEFVFGGSKYCSFIASKRVSRENCIASVPTSCCGRFSSLLAFHGC